MIKNVIIWLVFDKRNKFSDEMMFYGGITGLDFIKDYKKIYEKQRKDFCMVGTHIGEAEG